LFHRTTREGAPAIPIEGCRGGEDGFVWFSKWLDCWGEQGRHLLEVMVEMTEQELQGFAHEAIADEEWDDETGDFVKIEDEAFIERFVWYAIPAAVVNPRMTAREIDPGPPSISSREPTDRRSGRRGCLAESIRRIRRIPRRPAPRPPRSWRGTICAVLRVGPPANRVPTGAFAIIRLAIGAAIIANSANGRTEDRRPGRRSRTVRKTRGNHRLGQMSRLLRIL
jgi:hypothetical protein